jgi:Fic family protein
VKPYEPMHLPLDCIDWSAHVTLVGQANVAIGRYDGMLHGIINPSVLLSPLTTQEAVLSSRIEGSQATVVEVLQYQADAQQPLDPDRRADIQEILNYRLAIAEAVRDFQTRPFSLNLLKQLHAILLDSVRGRDKSPGRFRRRQNWIGPFGEGIERATYVPPVWEQVEPALHNWEEYVHAEERDPLVQLALVKAQFELIHPFEDGNGRLGRMLIPILLFEKGILSNPVFYLSAYLDRHRDAYVGRLLAISEQGDWNGWVTFFLTALAEQAVENTVKTRKIMSLYERMKAEVPRTIHSQYIVQAIDALFDRPVFQIPDFGTRSGIPKHSALRILNELRSNGIVRDLRLKQGRRGAILSFPDLLEIVEG